MFFFGSFVLAKSLVSVKRLYLKRYLKYISVRFDGLTIKSKTNQDNEAASLTYCESYDCI